MILERYNGKLHSTIKCTPMAALMPSPPSYAEVQKQIIYAAAKVYGERVVDRAQPAFSSEGALEDGALVRKSIWKAGLPGNGSWQDSIKQAQGRISGLPASIGSRRSSVGGRGRTRRTESPSSMATSSPACGRDNSSFRSPWRHWSTCP